MVQIFLRFCALVPAALQIGPWVRAFWFRDFAHWSPHLTDRSPSESALVLMLFSTLHTCPWRICFKSFCSWTHFVAKSPIATEISLATGKSIIPPDRFVFWPWAYFTDYFYSFTFFFAVFYSFTYTSNWSVSDGLYMYGFCSTQLLPHGISISGIRLYNLQKEQYVGIFLWAAEHTCFSSGTSYLPAGQLLPVAHLHSS